MSARQSSEPVAPDTVVIEPWPGIGDMVWHLPAMRALAASDPSGRIDIVARDKVPARALLREESVMRACLPLPMGRGLAGRTREILMLAKTLRQGHYGRAFIFHDSTRYALAARLAGIPRIFGYGFGLQKYLLTQKARISQAVADQFPLKRANAILDLAGVARDPAMPKLTPGRAALAAVTDKYAAMPWPEPWAAFAIASLGRNRIWPAERFAAVADRLWEAGWRSIFLLGVARERSIAEAIAAACGKARPTIVTDSPLDETIALLSRCAFALCNDSGLMNIAAALCVPVYVPFGVPFGASGDYDFSGDLEKLFSPYLHPILPVGGVDRALGASKITVEQVLSALARDGIFDGSRHAI